MKKYFYKLAIAALGLFGALSTNGQTPCDSAYLAPNYNISEVGAYNYQRCTPNNYELNAHSYSKTPLYFQWKTKSGDFLSEGTFFNEDTLGEFYLEIEGLGCVKPIPFTIEDAPVLSLYVSSEEYCKDGEKPTLTAQIHSHSGTTFGFNSYALSKDNKFIADVYDFYELENAEAGTYTLSPLNQACWENSQTITITEKDCSPGICEPLKVSVYQTVFDGQIHKSCDLAGWELLYPEDKIPTGVEVIWKQNGNELSRNHIALSIDVTATNSPDTYSVETSSENCTWSKEILIRKDSINADITSSDANYRYCENDPIVITAKGNEHLTGETYIWEKKNINNLYELYGKGITLPNPEVGEYRMYVETSLNCYSTPTEFAIYEDSCSTTCPEIEIFKEFNLTNFPPSNIKQGYVTICNQNSVLLNAIPTFGTGSITWHEVSNTDVVDYGFNPLHVYSPGKLIAKYTDENCSINSDTINVHYGFADELSITPMVGTTELPVHSDTIKICTNSELQLNPNPYYHINYMWELDAVFLTNNISVDDAELGHYDLYAEDYQGCLIQSSITVVEDKSENCIISGINDLATSTIDFAPNPTNDILTLFGRSEVNTVQLISQLGSTNVIEVINNTIDLSNYSAGVYTLLIENNGTIEAHKIVKQ